MDANNAPNDSTSSNAPPLPRFVTVDDGTNAPGSDVPPRAPEAPHEAETKDERRKRQKRERDRRYRERQKGGTGSTRPEGGAPPPGTGARRSPVQDAVDELRAEFAQAPGDGGTTQAAPGTPGAPAFVATGDLLLGMCNATLPGLVAKFANRNRVDPVDASAVALSPEQVRMLKPSAAPAEAYLLQNLPPVVIFAATLAGALLANVPPPTARDKEAQAQARAARNLKRNDPKR